MLSPAILVDQSAQANRLYNTFLIGDDPANQKVAYSGFTQTLNHVFACREIRVRFIPHPPLRHILATRRCLLGSFHISSEIRKGDLKL